MPETETIKPHSNTQAQAWDNLARDVAINTTPDEAEDQAVGTLDDGVDIGTDHFEQPKADELETKLEQADGTTHLRTNPETTAVTMPEAQPKSELEPSPEPAPELDPTSAESAPAVQAEQQATADQELADQAYHLEEPDAPEL